MYAAVVHKKLDTKKLPRTGRPKKITAHGTRQLKNIVKSNRTKTLESLTNLFNSGKDDQVSSKTVARTLHSLGFRARKACRKPMISKKNLKKRLEFYNKLARFACSRCAAANTTCSQKALYSRLVNLEMFEICLLLVTCKQKTTNIYI